MKRYSIINKISAIVLAAFLLTACAVLLLSNFHLTTIIESSQKAIYEEKLNTILRTLYRRTERLDATGMRTAYEDAFKDAAIKALRRTYHKSSGRRAFLFVFDKTGAVLMPADLAGDDGSLRQAPFVKKGLELLNGDFNYSSPDGASSWCIIKNFPEWGWIIGYSVPLNEKYADARIFRNRLLLTMTLILVIVMLTLFAIINKMIQPIKSLTIASEAMAAGDLDQKVAIAGRDELASLARSFVQMRDAIREKISEQQARTTRARRQQDAVSTLATSELISSEDFSRFAGLLTETAAAALEVSRASVWLFTEDRGSLKCIDLFKTENADHTRGEELSVDDYPRYFEALAGGVPIDAGIAATDPRTAEFADTGLTADGIASMLDTVIHVAGRDVGAIRLGHGRTTRDWQADEIIFASSIAEQAAQALVNCRRLEAEKALRRLQNYLKNIINSMPSMLVGVDRDGRITQWNLEAEKATGLAADHAQGRMMTEVLPQLSGEIEKIRIAIQDRNIQKNTRVARHDNGGTRYSDITIYPLIANGVEGAVIRVDDITDRVRIEEMMIQTEKMISVGGLAAGMAHEINNPLAGIMQNLQVLRLYLTDDTPKNRSIAGECGLPYDRLRDFFIKREIPAIIETIMDSGKRAAGIVDNMLSFSRKSDKKFTVNNLAELLDRTVDLAAKDYDLKKKYDFRRIKIVREYGEDTADVLCEAGQIQQVFLNILKNGAQAMSTAGIKNARFILRVRAEGGMTRVEIEDNGPGLDADARKRAFEPFFTTKEVGIGTGLGLSVSYFIIVENHGGSMEVVSMPDRGAKFIILLPTDGSTGRSGETTGT